MPTGRGVDGLQADRLGLDRRPQSGAGAIGGGTGQAVGGDDSFDHVADDR